MGLLDDGEGFPERNNSHQILAGAARLGLKATARARVCRLRASRTTIALAPCSHNNGSCDGIDPALVRGAPSMAVIIYAYSVKTYSSRWVFFLEFNSEGPV